MSALDRNAKARLFKELHAGPGAFVIPNPWDAGSAKVLASLGFKALATTSAGFAFSRALRDGVVSRSEALSNAEVIVEAAPDLPVSADLEDGYGDAPEIVADTIRFAAHAGLAGGSIEDATGDPQSPIYDFDHAVERIAAAVEAARAADPFVLTARAEGFLYGRPDLDDVIRRLTAFEAAGADVLYAPALPDLDAIRTVCQSVSKPVNVVVGLGRTLYTVEELSDAGVRRISLGSSLSRYVLGQLSRAAKEIQEHGSFSFLSDSLSFAETSSLMGAAPKGPRPARDEPSFLRPQERS
jgi:2-methylisocitrate lyase-like PEP mutase family enzyme